jgi:hypothetical protein
MAGGILSEVCRHERDLRLARSCHRHAADVKTWSLTRWRMPPAVVRHRGSPGWCRPATVACLRHQRLGHFGAVWLDERQDHGRPSSSHTWHRRAPRDGAGGVGMQINEGVGIVHLTHALLPYKIPPILRGSLNGPPIGEWLSHYDSDPLHRR